MLKQTQTKILTSLVGLSVVLLTLLVVLPNRAEALGALSVSNVTISESNSNSSASQASILFILSAAPTADVTINYSTNGQCTIKDGSGVSKNSGSLLILTGASSVSSIISATNDETAEGTHACQVSFYTASADPNFNGVNKNYSATIKDNDGLPSLSIVVGEDSHLKEGNLSYRNVYSVIRGDEEPTSPIYLNVWTDNQCALLKTSGSGYTSQIQITVKDTAVPIVVVANDDEIAEGDHTCHVQHLVSTSDPAYKNNPVDSRYITIVDNEAAPAATATPKNDQPKEAAEVSIVSQSPAANQQFVGQYHDEPIRLHDPDAPQQLFIILISSSVVVGAILGWWRFGRATSDVATN